MRLLPGLLAAAALAGAAAPAGAADELGRLFFTPEQRAALDARRRTRTPDKPMAAVISPTVRLDGYVKRSSGHSTVWVNGESLQDKGHIPSSTDAPVSVSVGEGAARIKMKPGEVLDRGNGEITDVIGDGEIKVRRATSSR
jgi:hypothetical protein